jgi:hypothetical protein
MTAGRFPKLFNQLTIEHWHHRRPHTIQVPWAHITLDLSKLTTHFLSCACYPILSSSMSFNFNFTCFTSVQASDGNYVSARDTILRRNAAIRHHKVIFPFTITAKNLQITQGMLQSVVVPNMYIFLRVEGVPAKSHLTKNPAKRRRKAAKQGSGEGVALEAPP